MGLITKKKKTTEEIKADLLKIEKNLSELERRMSGMFTNLVGEDTRAEDIARHEARLNAFDRHDMSTTMYRDEEIATMYFQMIMTQQSLSHLLEIVKKGTIFMVNIQQSKKLVKY